MLRKVVDTNYLRHPDLEAYLGASSGNRVVLMDLQSMEMHKREPEIAARNSTVITSRYPRQVLVLRPTRPIYTLRLNTRAKVTQLISERETRGFAAYGLAHQANVGEPRLIAKVVELGAGHRRHWEELVLTSAHIPQTFKGYVGSLTADERRVVRESTPYPPALQLKLLALARDIAIDLFRVVGEPERHRPNEKVHLKDTLVFRYALCIMLRYTRWVANGQHTDTPPEKVANDVIDWHVAALGTFFDGVLSHDRNLNAVHRTLRHLLRAGRGFVG